MVLSQNSQEGRICSQTNPVILKTTHLACHARVHAPKFDTVISFPKLTNKMIPSPSPSPPPLFDSPAIFHAVLGGRFQEVQLHFILK